MERTLRAVIFDYGNTLVTVDPALRSKRTDYADVVAVPGAERMARLLEARGVIRNEDGIAFIDRFLEVRERNRIQADESGDEIPAERSLREVLSEFAFRAGDKAEIAEVLGRFFSVEEELLREIPGAGETLRRLRERGVKLGLLSNATNGASIARGVDKFGWRPWFDPFVVSADIGVRKPRPEAFRAVLDAWSFQPDEVAIVGDSLRHDIGGGQSVGIRTFHLTWIANPMDPPHLGRIVPDLSAGTHRDLLPMLLRAADVLD